MSDRFEEVRSLDVKLGGDWLDFWLPKLDEMQLKLYLEVAHFTNSKTYHSVSEFTEIFPDRTKTQINQTLRGLEELGLIEVVRKDTLHHYHLRHVDEKHYHRARPCRPSVHAAIHELEQMLEELEHVSRCDDTAELREEIFAKYPRFRQDYERYLKSKDADPQQWKLWMELGIHLQQHFDREYGLLREQHFEIFKELSERFVQLNLAVVDQITADILHHKQNFFPHVSDTWVACESESVFIQKKKVKSLAKQYSVGPEQIFLNVIEALQAEGNTVVELGANGKIDDLALPTNTGLTEAQERLLFLRPDEFTAEELDDTETTYQLIRQAQEAYAEHLIGCGVMTLAEASALDFVADVDPLLATIKTRVNEALELVAWDGAPAAMRPRPVSLGRVREIFDSCGQRSA